MKRGDEVRVKASVKSMMKGEEGRIIGRAENDKYDWRVRMANGKLGVVSWLESELDLVSASRA